MIDKYFDQTYLINLEKRPDRLKAAKKEAKSIGLSFKTIYATDGNSSSIDMFEYDPVIERLLDEIAGWNKYAAALNDTTLRIIEDAEEKGYESILILEDDIKFSPNINTIVNTALKNGLPEKWHCINFGGRHLKPITEKVNNNLYITRASDYCHCYAIHKDVFKLFKKKLKEMNKPVDMITAYDIHSLGYSYSITPFVVSQRRDYSNIRNMEVDHVLLR